MKRPITSSLGLAILVGVSLATPARAVVSIDFVTVGNTSNAPDPATGNLYGTVIDNYQISKNETTSTQYAEFLNAVAKTDTYNLFKTEMGLLSGVTRSGVSGTSAWVNATPFPITTP